IIMSPPTYTLFPYTTLFRSKLNIPIFAIVDTNANPQLVDYPIPANDDAAKSIQTILENFVEAIKKGQQERIGAMEEAEREDEERSEEHTSELQSRENLVCRL